MIYKVVLVSGVQQSDSVRHIYTIYSLSDGRFVLKYSCPDPSMDPKDSDLTDVE